MPGGSRGLLSAGGLPRSAAAGSLDGRAQGADPGLYTPAVAGRFHDLSDLTQVLQTGDVAGLSVAFTGSSGAWADAFGVASADGTSADAGFDVSGRLGEQGRHGLRGASARGRRPPGPGRGRQRGADFVAAAAGTRMAARGQRPRAACPRGGCEQRVGRGFGQRRAGSRPAGSPGGNRHRAAARAGRAARPDLGVFRRRLSRRGPGRSATSPGWGSHEAMAELVLGPAGMAASTFRQPLPGSLERAAARGHRGGEPVPGGWRNQPDVGAVGLWTTPLDLVRFARVVSSDRSVQMLQGHPVEPRMGSGVFLTASEHGARWWSHSGLVTGYASLLACHRQPLGRHHVQ